MKNIEAETKFEISDEDFRRLKSFGRIGSYHDQLNIYYDYNCLLSKRGATFRLRLSDGNAVLTLKLPFQQKLGYREALEIEQPIGMDVPAIQLENFNVDRDLPIEFKKYLKELGIKNLEKIGSMRTQRWLIELPNGSRVELDQVHLPNGDMFFEVEFESAEIKLHEMATQIIRQLAASARPSMNSKYERFVRALNSTHCNQSNVHAGSI